jgi:mono/diheme cytochrome c family protein
VTRTERFRLMVLCALLVGVACWCVAPSFAQLTDRTQNPNTGNFGIAKSLAQQVGAGRGNVNMPDSSMFIIKRDPFRAIRRGRQLFQRKFLRSQGLGPLTGDGVGDINSTLALGAGLVDSCAGCHGRPRGSAGFGGDVVTRPDSRDAPHLFGLGLKEMLADEITTDLRNIRADAIRDARRDRGGRGVTRDLISKGINYGRITARSDGSVDTSQVRGVNPDLRVRPFFFQGGTISIREFIVGAWRDEMGLRAVDPELAAASNGGRFVTPSGMVLDGSTDSIERPFDALNQDGDGDGVANEIPTPLVDFMEFYLLNYFKPGLQEQTQSVAAGRQVFNQIGCAVCHIPDLTINRDRRVADVETVFNPTAGNPFNRLFATATPRLTEVNDNSGYPSIKNPNNQSFVVRNIFTDFKRHDLGPNFYERNFNGTMQREFLTTPLWGVGTTATYGHDGRSSTLTDVILRHGGEAQTSRDNFDRLSAQQKQQVLDLLNSLVLFAPDDTASNLDPGVKPQPGATPDPNRPYPQFNGGSIKLGAIFDPQGVDPE